MKHSWYTLINRTLVGLIFGLLTSIAIAAPNTEGIQVYQKNFHLSEERKQSLVDDIDRYNNADNIWGTLRQNFTLPHYENSARVQEQINWFMNNQDFLYRSASRAAPYLYYILQQVKKRHLPAEVALLPIIESSFNPFSLSPAGAAGIWQLMPGTASGLGVKQNWWYDGRRDVVTSTKAALNYLAYLGEFFDGNWLYAIAAYDTGEGNLLSAIKKNIRTGDTTDFWSLPVAQETRDYIPKILALAVIISHPDQYPVQLPYVRNAPYLAQVDIGAQIDLNHAASLAGLSLKELKQLNPGYSRAATDPNGPFKLVLPIENVQQFTENLSNSPVYRRINWIHYKSKSGDTLTTVAKQFDTSPSQLKQINPTLAHNIKSGTSIIIPRSSPTLSKTILEAEQPEELASNNDDAGKVKSKLQQLVATDTHKKSAQPAYVSNDVDIVPGQYKLQPGDTLYMVRNSDNIEKVARHFRTSTQTIIAANNLGSHPTLHAGAQLIIPTHAVAEDQNTEEAKKYSLSPGDTLYMVRKGDTLEKIAMKYHVSPAALRLTNLISDSDMREGLQLVIPTHV